MKKIKVHKIPKFKKKILIVLIILLCLPISFTLGRFVYNKVLDLYFTSKNFFFESDKLTVDGAIYSLDYWNGVDPYNVVINLNSFKNNELKSTSDVTYEINLPDYIQAPITQGQVIGTVSYILNGEVISTVNLVADSTINKINILSMSKDVYSSWFSLLRT